jgi:hypothetical protein
MDLEELANLKVDLLNTLRGAVVLLAAGGVSNLRQTFHISVSAVGDSKNCPRDMFGCLMPRVVDNTLLSLLVAWWV